MSDVAIETDEAGNIYDSDNEAIAGLAEHSYLAAMALGSPSSFALINLTAGVRLVEFGRKHDFPAAEAFARQAGAVGGPAFNAAAWKNDALYRAGWEAYRAVIAALAPLKLGFDPVPEPVRRPAPGPAPDDRALERVGGAFDRVTLQHPAPGKQAPLAGGAGTPLSLVRGIGDGIERRLMRVGVANAEQLAAMSDVDLDALADHDSQLPDLLRKSGLMGLGKSPIEAARALVNDRTSG